MKYDLKELRTATQAILDAIDPGDPPWPNEAINYADLRCAAAYRREDHDGEVDYEVWIEEASSDAEKLQLHVSEQLAKCGFVGVEVRTEWWSWQLRLN